MGYIEVSIFQFEILTITSPIHEVSALMGCRGRPYSLAVSALINCNYDPWPLLPLAKTASTIAVANRMMPLFSSFVGVCY